MANVFYSVVLCVALFGAYAQAAGQCREANGTSPVSGSCDAYIECKNGVAEEKLCPDGLLYNEKSSGYPCGYPIEVECQQQARLQSAQPTEECPHQFGYYRMGDAKNCGQFKNCADGRGYVLDCPEGLAWNKETYRCDWPDLVEDCDAEAFLGFKCPAPVRRSPELGEQEETYEFYPSQDDCQVYFLCVEGKPRRIKCDEASAFNQETKSCDDIENVPNCSPAIKQLGQEIKNARLAVAGGKKRTANAADSVCRESNGRFASEEQCDAYVECHEGVAEEKLCPDGLLFHQRTRTTGDCTYAPFTTCKDRTRLQPANGTDECPRQFGFYSTGDAANCGTYKNCAHGEATLTKCPEGLAFNVDSYQCDWPDLVAECDAEAYLGFQCPAVEDDGSDKHNVDSTPEGVLHYYRHPKSCKKYFVCVKGKPRLYTCAKFSAFNSETKLCDFYTHVPECYAKVNDPRIPVPLTVEKPDQE